MIPRKFFEERFKEWQSGGYSMIDFTGSKVDLTRLPVYYQQKYNGTQRRIERNYLLNHLIYHEIASVRKANDIYVFDIAQDAIIPAENQWLSVESKQMC